MRFIIQREEIFSCKHETLSLFNLKVDIVLPAKGFALTIFSLAVVK